MLRLNETDVNNGETACRRSEGEEEHVLILGLNTVLACQTSCP
jgi:hypothetical protein